MNFLDEIIEVKKEEIKKLKQFRTLLSFHDEEFFSKNNLSFSNAIKNKNRISVIAEIKKASPSKGIIRKNFDPIQIANDYFTARVDAVSILTDEKFFRGNINYLYEVAKIKTVPLLRKDFIIDEYQIFEANAFGADAILLIAEVLSPTQINELTCAAKYCNMDVLFELHSEDQLQKINFNENKIIGINNRNLEDFTVNIETTLNISQKIADDLIIVSESGFNGKNELDLVKPTKVNAVLIGEYFMKKENIKESVIEFLEWTNF